MTARISQFDLVTGITKLLGKQGVKDFHPFQFNAVIAAANSIVAAFQEEFKEAQPAMGLHAWYDSHDTGQSSKFMAFKLADGHPAGHNYPHDPADFGRCHRFLEAVPTARLKLATISAEGPVWKALVEAWDELTALYLEEMPKGKATKLYARMQAIIGGAK